jgi:hypothetical protein
LYLLQDDSVYLRYCRRIRGTHWGSDIEIQALCKVTGHSVQVYSAERIIWYDAISRRPWRVFVFSGFVRFHPDIGSQAQYEIERAHVGLWANEDDAAEFIASDSKQVPPELKPAPKATIPLLKKPPKVFQRSNPPKSFVKVELSDYMPLALRLKCFAEIRPHIRGESFSALERNALVSFAVDNPSRSVGSRVTWERFISETGSVRHSGASVYPLAMWIVKFHLCGRFPEVVYGVRIC